MGPGRARKRGRARTSTVRYQPPRTSAKPSRASGRAGLSSRRRRRRRAGRGGPGGCGDRHRWPVEGRGHGVTPRAGRSRSGGRPAATLVVALPDRVQPQQHEGVVAGGDLVVDAGLEGDDGVLQQHGAFSGAVDGQLVEPAPRGPGELAADQVVVVGEHADAEPAARAAAPARWSCRLAMQKDTRAGSRETLVNELAAMPTGCRPSRRRRRRRRSGRRRRRGAARSRPNSSVTGW